MRTSRTALFLLAALSLGALAWQLLPQQARAAGAAAAPQAPAFTHAAPRDWLNSRPLNWTDLEGQVVLLDFWTFMCWNCYRSFPWLTSLEDHFADAPFTVIGVHTPEFESEKDRDRVAARAAHFGLHHPIMIDNDRSYWNALHNRYWPAYYLIDKHGRIRHAFAGETHAGDARAGRIESRLRALLAEP